MPIEADMALKPFEESEALALRALGFLNREGPRLGLKPVDPGMRPIPPRALAKVLDTLITDERALRAFAALIDRPPEAAYEARRRLQSG